MDAFSTASSGGVIVSAPTVSSDIAATAAALSADESADAIGAETRRSASAMVSRLLRNAGALLSFFGALLRWRRGLMEGSSGATEDCQRSDHSSHVAQAADVR